jgi:hypothetical protein
MNGHVNRFNACLNKSVEVIESDREYGIVLASATGLPVHDYSEIICPQFPRGGIKFNHRRVLTDADDENVSELASNLGCANCPYSTLKMAGVVIKHFDKSSSSVEQRFEQSL